MERCHHCGEAIEFATISGNRIPIHLYKNCTAGNRAEGFEWSREFDFKYSEKSYCHKTNCQSCGDSVFFIRHNGGSVWIDPPLGPPWYKHDCMHQKTSDSRTSILKDDFLQKFADQHTLLGVVNATKVIKNRKCSVIRISTKNKKHAFVLVKSDATSKLGKIVLYFSKDREIKILPDLQETLKVVSPISLPGLQISEQVKIKCPVCDEKVPLGELSSHLLQVHYFNVYE